MRKILSSLFICTVSVVSHAQQTITVIAGETTTVQIGPINSTERCNIAILIDGKTEQRVIEPPNRYASINYNSETVGKTTITWEGKNFFRGVRSAIACPNKGAVTINVTSNTEQRLAEWNRLFSDLKPMHAQCVRVGLEYRGVNFKLGGLSNNIDTPHQRLASQIVERCRIFANIKENMGQPDQEPFECTIEAYKSRCIGIFVDNGANSPTRAQRISFETAVQYQIDGRSWTTNSVELEASIAERLKAKKDGEERQRIEREAFQERLRAEQREREQRAAIERAAFEEKLRIERAVAEELLKAAAAERVLTEEKARAAKLDADEKERAWKSSPEYRAQQEEEARRVAEEIRVKQEKAAADEREKARIAEQERLKTIEIEAAQKRTEDEKKRAEAERIAQLEREREKYKITPASFINVMDILIKEGLAYGPSKYPRGKIPEGEYAIVGKSGAYFNEELNGQTLVSKEFDSFGYVYTRGIGSVEVKGYLINEEGIRKIDQDGAFSLYKSLVNQPEYKFGGFYKVGKDLKPGKYKISSIGSMSYVGIDSGPIGRGGTIRNLILRNETTEELSSGQYLEIRRASFTLLSQQIEVSRSESPSGSRGVSTSSTAAADVIEHVEVRSIPKSDPFYKNNANQYWRCGDAVSQRLLETIYNELSRITDSESLPRSDRESCYVSIGPLLGTIVYTVWIFDNPRNMVYCIYNNTCHNIRVISFPRVNGQVHRQYLVKNTIGTQITRYACIAQNGVVVNERAHCSGR